MDKINTNLIQKIKKDLQKNLSEKRYKHTISVAETAFYLAEKYKHNKEDAYLAGLLHDYTKEYSNEENLKIIKKEFPGEEIVSIPKAWHGYTASVVVVGKYQINNLKILNAIKYHTLGHFEMDEFAKLIYIADYIEPLRPNIDFVQYDKLISQNSLKELFKKIFLENYEHLKKKSVIIPQQTQEIYQNML